MKGEIKHFLFVFLHLRHEVLKVFVQSPIFSKSTQGSCRILRMADVFNNVPSRSTEKTKSVVDGKYQSDYNEETVVSGFFKAKPKKRP